MTSYSDTPTPAAHNAFASSQNGFLLWPQQTLSISKQLEIGVRGFMLDLYLFNASIVLRHVASGGLGIAKPVSGQTSS